VLERLEGRVVPSYAFSYNATTHVATAQSTGGNNDALVLDQSGGDIEYNLNGTGASTSWGGQAVPNSAATTVNIVEASGGTGESVTIGSAAAPISTLAAHFATPSTQVPTSSSLTFNDAAGAIQAVGTSAYSYNNGSFSGPGPGAAFTFTSSVAQTLGVAIDGSPLNSTFNVLATLANTPVFVVAGAGTNVVNVGSNATNPAASTLSGVRSTVNVTDPLGTTSLNIDDAATSASAAGSIDFLSAPSFEVTGLGFASGGKVTFNGAGSGTGGTGVSSLVVNLGRSGGSGVTMNVASTPAGTLTTINGGVNPNTYNLSSASAAGGLGNLQGPLVVNNNTSGLGSITLNDQSAGGNDTYTLTGTTLTRTGTFGGLTYSGFGLGALNLNAETTLASGGADMIAINGTASGTMTTVNGDNGADTININGTSGSGTLFVTTGATGGSTVNVAADLVPLNIQTHGATQGPDTVNLGGASPSGTIAGIVGPLTLLGIAPYALNVNDQGDAAARTSTFAISNGTNTGSLALGSSGPFLSFRPADLTSLTMDGGGQGNTIHFNTTPASITTAINAGAGNNVVDVAGTGPGSTLAIDAQGGSSTVVLGGNATAPLGLQDFLGAGVNVVDSTGTASLVLDDGGDTGGRTATLTGSSVTGLTPAPINFTAPAAAGGDGVAALAINGGSGGNLFTVNGTLANGGPAGETINNGAGSDTVEILATTASGPLFVHGEEGSDQVLITDAGSVAGIAGPISVDAAAGHAAIVVDASADTASHPGMLIRGGDSATLSGLTAAPISYVPASISTLTIDTRAAGNQFLTVDFSQGNPIPTGAVPGLVDNAGADTTSAANSHVLNLLGTLPDGAFASETHNAEDPAQMGPAYSGDLDFATSQGTATGVAYTGLQPINDSVAATLYTFNDLGYPDPSFTIGNGPPLDGASSLLFLSTPAPPGPLEFETTTIANKASVVFNTPPQVAGVAGPGVIGHVELPAAPAGLTSLSVNTPDAGDNTVAWTELPGGVSTSYGGGGGADVTTVSGTGVPGGSTFALDGAAASNTLKYDAGGLDPTVTEGSQRGAVRIALPGFGSVLAVDYQQIVIVDVAPLTILPGAALTIDNIEGVPFVDTAVSTFTLPLPAILPASAGQAPGFPAADFTATIDWGDPAPDLATGAVLEDADNPGLYTVTGTHTFGLAGTFGIASALAFGGAMITGTVSGASVSVAFNPVATTAGTGGTAVVTQAPLDITVLPVVGTEGQPIAAGPIATFRDNGGANPAADYTATLSIIDAAGVTTMIPGATIAENGDAPEYTVIAPSFTLPDEGTYQVVVTITDQSGTTPLTLLAGGVAVNADAPLSAGSPVSLAANTGLALSGSLVATFTDANPAAAATDFTAAIDWGDGTPSSTGAVVATTGSEPGAFGILGSHAYALPGRYTTTVVITDAGAATVTLTGTAAVSDAPLAGIPRSISAVEGQDTGTVVLATIDDPNPLAAAADLTASVDWGDSGGSSRPATVVLTGRGSAGTSFEVVGSHTYAEEGTFPITLKVTTAGGAATAFTPASGTATVSDAPLSLGLGAPVAGVAGSALATGTVVATFADSDPAASDGDFSSTIDWGDGTAPSAGHVSPDPAGGSTFQVTGTHVYDKEGSYPLTVAIQDAGGSATTAHGQATVADAPLVPIAAEDLSATEGTPLANITLATFTDPDPAAIAGEFTTVIDWGDGSPLSAGTVSGSAGGPFTVTGSHTYADERTTAYPITAQVTDAGGSQGTASLSATVSDAPLIAAAGIVVAAVEGAPFQSVPVAMFRDTNTLGAATDFTAMITWGDGTDSPGSITALGKGSTGASYEVLGSHTFAQAGEYAIGVLVTDTGGAATAPGPIAAVAKVADAPLSAAGAAIDGSEGVPLTALLAVLSDANPGGTAGDYQATIDWGDGTAPGAGTVALGAAGGGTFEVTGTHTYLEEGNYPLAVTISDSRGATAVATGSAAIADVPPAASVVQPVVTATEGQEFSGAVASFIAIVGALAEPGGDFSATIDWGDGTAPTRGTIAATSTPGVYLVTGSHVYRDSGVNIGGTPRVPSGMFPVAVLVQDEGGGTRLIANEAAVRDVPIALTGWLDPASDSGASNSDALTDLSEPTFRGTSEPFSTIALYAAPISGGGPELVGQTQADGSGAWSITTSLLTDGRYTITAHATDAAGATTAATQILPDATEGLLTIATAGPRVTAVQVEPLRGTIAVTFQPGLAPLDPAWLDDAASYIVMRQGPRPKPYRASARVVAHGGPGGAETVLLLVNHGQALPGGTYNLTILSGSGATGIRDLAGNALAGTFRGSFPSGSGVARGNFMAAFSTRHHRLIRLRPLY
jgi:hypothetical protein